VPEQRSGQVTEGRPRHETFPVVGIGASAGGLEAFEKFFKAMPSDSGMAFVIVQHLDPTHKSLLTDLVKKFTEMQVLEIEDGMLVAQNTVYVIPPSCDLVIVRGYLHLMDQIKMHGRRLPIDTFFRSLAADVGDKAVAIVLSGTGTEGVLGIKAIKEQDGMVMVQAPESAQFDGMPRSALATGQADYVLPPEKMPEQLVAYVRRTAGSTEPRHAPQPPKPPSDQLHRILTLLRAQTGHDFTHYKQNTVIRRIERRMSVNQIEDFAGYARYMTQNPPEVETLFNELLIEVTNFFRDPEAFAALREKVIPRIFEDRPADSPIRVWVPGCSTGEEAYSIAMLLREAMDGMHRDYKAQIFATDIDRNAVEVGRGGTYTDSISVDIPSEVYYRFFNREGHTYHVRKPIRDTVVFALQSVIKDPPFSRLDLVSCRNLLIYMGPELQKRVLRLFHYALKPGGYLFLGSSESIGEFGDLFTPVDRKWKIYERRRDGTHHAAAADYLSRSAPYSLEDLSDREGKPPEKVNLREIAERALMKIYAPAAAIVNEKGDVLYIHGHTGNYLEPASGEASMNIVAMAREGMRLELGSALRRAASQKLEIRSSHLRVKSDGEEQDLTIVVKPLEDSAAATGLMLVVFEALPAPPSGEHAESLALPAETNRRFTELEQELTATRESLNASVKELETSNEELKSANEELQSANEELQSTNEELETSKEELQSVNEELVTVNAELEMNLEELSRVNADLSNLLSSTDIGTIFLDESLNVERYTPAAARFVNLIPGDIGRPMAHLVTNLEGGGLTDDARHVLDTLHTREREMRTTRGRWCLVRMLPYRTLDNVVKGVVMAFIDITDQKHAQERLQVLTRAIEQSPGIVMITNLQDEIEYVNPKFTIVTGYTPEEVIGKSPRFLRSEEYTPDFFEQMRNTLLAGKEWHGELHNRKKSGDMYWERVSISPLRNNGETITQVVAVGEDISELRQLESLRRLAAVVRDSGDAISVLDFDGKIVSWNRGASEIYGYSEAEALAMNIRDLVPEAERATMLDRIRKLQNGEAVEPARVPRRTRDGKLVELWMTMTRLADEAGKAFGISVTERDITSGALRPWESKEGEK